MYCYTANTETKQHPQYKKINCLNSKAFDNTGAGIQGGVRRMDEIPTN